MVHAHHKHRRVVFGRSRHHHASGAGIDVGASSSISEKKSSTFKHIIHANIPPGQIIGIPLSANANRPAIHQQLIVFHLHLALKSAMGGIVAEHIAKIINIDQVINSHHLHIIQGHGTAKSEATDAAKAVDADADGHGGVRRGVNRLMADHKMARWKLQRRRN